MMFCMVIKVAYTRKTVLPANNLLYNTLQLIVSHCFKIMPPMHKNTKKKTPKKALVQFGVLVPHMRDGGNI
jgi:hypothetical protein